MPVSPSGHRSCAAVDRDTIVTTFSIEGEMEKRGINVRRNGPNLVCCCPFHKERTPSFTIFPDGGSKCFGCGFHGTVIDVVMAFQGFTNPREAMDFLAGGNAMIALPHASGPKGEAKTVDKVEVPEIPLWSRAVGDWWAEGQEFAGASKAVIEVLGNWRGWSEHDTRLCYEAGFFVTPLIRGRRVIAFPVVAPKFARYPGAGTGGEDHIPVAAHYRFFPQGITGRAQWYFHHSSAECGYKIPSLPFIIGRFGTAHTIIITEGQWEAITLAIAEGWLADGAWPRGLCVIGIRSASGIRPFLDHYLPHWPREAQALLVCDNDTAGKAWHDELAKTPCFLSQVRRRGTAASAITTNLPDKDINDAYRAGRWPKGTIWRALEAFAQKEAA